jgi:DNA primase
MQQYDFTNTVAVSGTALTEKQLTILKRLTHRIYLCFDNDKA